MVAYSEASFQYNGSKYLFNASVYSYQVDKEQLSFGLDNNSVLSFEYVNEFNKLYIDGTLVYRDVDGVIDKFLEKTVSFVDIVFAKLEQTTDGDLTFEKQSPTEKFYHTFFINNIKILSREGHAITYNISLVSANWLKLSGNIKFSNYGREPEDVFAIIKSMLASNGLNIDKDTFEAVTTPVKLNYITNGNDNSITSIEYLLGKLYYYSLKDTCMKFIVYNEFKDEYSVFNITDINNLDNYSLVVVSMFKSATENIMQEDPNELNSVTKFPKTSIYQNYFSREFIDYNYNENAFTDKFINTDSIVKYQNQHVDSNIYKDKYDFTDNNISYLQRGCYWNNDFNIYANAVKTLVDSSSIVINTTGEILRKPGHAMQLNVDRDIKYIEGESIDDVRKIKNKYKSIEGAWIASKIRHIVMPSSIQTTKPRYRQNLVLTRNYVKKEK